MNAAEKLVKARTELVLRHPFFGVLALRLEPQPRADVETCATDGERLFYNERFVESLPLDELMGVVAHEVMHCAHGHPWRRGNRDARKWNMACDYAINGIILDAGMRLPRGALRDPAFDGLAAELVYARLPDQPPGGGQGQGGAGGGQQAAPGGRPGADGGGDGWNVGGVEDAPQSAAGGATRAVTETDWRIAAGQALQAAKRQGTLPGNLAEAIEEAVRPRVDWRGLMHEFLQESAGREDYTWRLPNARFAPHGLYLPFLRGESVRSVVVAVDTSASIGKDEAAAFIAEVRSALEAVRVDEAWLVMCDAEVRSFEPLRDADDVPDRLVGRGGTRFAPVFEEVRRRAVEPACLVYLTDLCSGDFGTPPDYPVMWVSTLPGSAPFGRVVRLDM